MNYSRDYYAAYSAVRNGIDSADINVLDDEIAALIHIIDGPNYLDMPADAPARLRDLRDRRNALNAAYWS